jgi:hypothetical protein
MLATLATLPRPPDRTRGAVRRTKDRSAGRDLAGPKGDDGVSGYNTRMWNPRLYDDRHAFVWRHGAELVHLLAPRPG